MDKKKIIIISAAIYPRNTPRAHRATELAKEFARRGHDVTIYAVLGKYDYSNFITQYKLNVRNIGKMFFYPVNSDGETKNNLLLKILTKLLKRWFEFPDIELMFKIPHILRKEQKADMLITIAIPHAVHWGVALYKSRHPINHLKTWIADCGDPYMGNAFNKPNFYFKYIEKWFCKSVNYISVPFEEARKGYYPEFHSKIIIIPQGFNFDEISYTNEQPNNLIPTFLYAGAFYKDKRDPTQFMQYLFNLKRDFKFIIYTRSTEIVAPYLEILHNKIEMRNYIPRSDLLKVMTKMDFLINFENKADQQLPSKLIDYALAKRPILSIPPNELPQKKLEEFFSGNYSNQLLINNIEQYNIINVANAFLSRIS